jgi:hypothetical protein
MLGRKELEQLRVQKQMLVVESSLHRQALLFELRQLRGSVGWIGNAARAPQRFVPLLTVLAPLAGFLAFRSLRSPGTLFKRLVAAAKWVGPVYSLWRSYSSVRKESRRPVAQRAGSGVV